MTHDEQQHSVGATSSPHATMSKGAVQSSLSLLSDITPMAGLDIMVLLLPDLTGFLVDHPQGTMDDYLRYLAARADFDDSEQSLRNAFGTPREFAEMLRLVVAH